MTRKFSSYFFKSPSIGNLAGIVAVFFLSFQPIFLVVYTDSYSLLPTLLALYFMVKAYRAKQSISVILFSVLGAVFSALAYLLRPSTAVFIVAFLIFCLLSGRSLKKIISNLKILLPFVVSLLIILKLFSVYVSSQKLVKIVPHQGTTVSYMILLGSHGNPNVDAESGTMADNSAWTHGAWNLSDVSLLTNSETRKEIFPRLEKRLADRGVIQNIKFYLQKFKDNVDTGVFYFHRDGSWVTAVWSKKGSFSNRIQNYIYQGGTSRASSNFIVQIGWIFILMSAIYGLLKKSNDSKLGLISLCLIGGLAFLEIFESGGTKYMIQYIPYLCIISAFGIKLFFEQFLEKAEMK